MFLGNLELENNIIYAPMAGCTDRAFRKTVRDYFKGLIFCEMVKMDALVRENVKTNRFLTFEEFMRPIGAQLCGSKIEYAKESAQIIEGLGFDVLDFNAGCPVKKVVKDGSGAAMLKDLKHLEKMLKTLVGAVKIPVTVKVRIGWTSSTLVAKEIVKIAEAAGVAAIFIHGRTRDQAYSGDPDLDYLRECRLAANKILVIANGGIFLKEDAKNMMDKTGADGLLLARGMLGKPWLGENCSKFLKNEGFGNFSAIDVKNALLKHFKNILYYENEKKALLDFRRVGCWYLKSIRGAKSLRVKINSLSNVDEAFEIIENFAFVAM